MTSTCQICYIDDVCIRKICCQSACLSCHVRYIEEKYELTCMFCTKELCPGSVKELDLSDKLIEKLAQDIFNTEKRHIYASRLKYRMDNVDKLIKRREAKAKHTKSKEELKVVLNQIAKFTAHRKLMEKQYNEYIEDNIDNTPKDIDFLSIKCPVCSEGRTDQKWRCNVCSAKICDNCSQERKDSSNKVHECKKNDVSDFEYMKNNAKPCPNCAIFIIRMDGTCNDMWCTNCKTAFEWHSLNRPTFKYHNPHFVDYRIDEGIRNAERLDVEIEGIRWVHPEEIPYYMRYYKIITRAVQKLRKELEEERLIYDFNTFSKLRMIWIDSVVTKKGLEFSEVFNTEVVEFFRKWYDNKYHYPILRQLLTSVNDALFSYINNQVSIIFTTIRILHSIKKTINQMRSSRYTKKIRDFLFHTTDTSLLLPACNNTNYDFSLDDEEDVSSETHIFDIVDESILGLADMYRTAMETI